MQTVNHLQNAPAGENDTSRKRVIHGWCMYDWANSAFATSVATAIMPVYFVALFKDAFGPETSFLGFTFTASSTWSLGIAISTALVAFSSPILGVISDRSEIKKLLLWIYTVVGALFIALSFFSAYTAAPWAWTLGCYLIANVGFLGGIVFYNSFLPYLGYSDEIDRISSRGFAYGYIGGGILLVIHLAAILAFTDSDHLDLVTRLAIASVSLWWFGWALWTFKTVPEPKITNPISELSLGIAANVAFSTLSRTFKELARFRILVIYLAAYLLFNDGIQTVLAVAGAFGPDTLGISLVSNMGTIVIVQFIAAVGAFLCGWIADSIGAKRTLALTLAGWCIVIGLAVGFAPLVPTDHKDFDYQLEHTSSGDYLVSNSPDLSDDGELDRQWKEAYGRLFENDILTRSQVRELVEAVKTSTFCQFSISVSGGSLNGTSAIGTKHLSILGEGPIDWWPRIMRKHLWEPLGLSVDLQWLMLGLLVGLVLGGSQALARSLFAHMTPESRSAEFFGFFGFIGRASAVFGPMIYLVLTGFYDTRIAILAILVIIVSGTSLLRWVDVDKGKEVALQEDTMAGGPNSK